MILSGEIQLKSSKYGIFSCSCCGKKFQRLISSLKKSSSGSLFCSKQCQYKGAQKNHGECNVCGKNLNRKNRKYCSKECSAKGRRKSAKGSIEDAIRMMSQGMSVNDVCEKLDMQRGRIDEVMKGCFYSENKRFSKNLNPQWRRECTEIQDVNEMDVMGNFGLRPEWRLPQAFTPEENNFNKWDYFELVGISPKFVTMHNINLARIKYTTTRNGKEVEESSVEVCTGDSIKECKSLGDSWEGVNHRISRLCKNNFTIIGVEVIKKIGETSLYNDKSKN